MPIADGGGEAMIGEARQPVAKTATATAEMVEKSMMSGEKIDAGGARVRVRVANRG